MKTFLRTLTGKQRNSIHNYFCTISFTNADKQMADDKLKTAANSAQNLVKNLASNKGLVSLTSNDINNNVLISGIIRAYDNDHWIDYKITVTTDGEILAEEDANATKSVYRNRSIKEFQIKPFAKIGPSRTVNAPGVFNLDVEQESEYNPADLLATQSVAESEKWINMLKYARCLKLQALKHPHPLDKIKNNTGSDQTLFCKICNSRSISRNIEGLQCLFCKDKEYEICKSCADKLNKALHKDKLVTSSNHPQHKLMEFGSAKEMHPYDPKPKVTCSQCNKISESIIYYCPRCDHVECIDCFQNAKELAKADPGDIPMQLELDFMKDLFTNPDGNRFKLSVKVSQRASTKLAIKSNQAWDLSTIDQAPVPSAYFEVTIHLLNDSQMVSIGVANQIFVQNKLLGDQQNSYGFFSDGKISMNSISDAKDGYTKFGKGDTVGVGMLYDSFNQRQLFFTKNGKMLYTVPKSVHRGMDCFPAISFTRKSGIDFSVNFTGPFKFDLASIPDYRADQSCKIVILPQEIIAKCFSYAVKTPSQVNEWRTISKVIGKAAIDNTIWKALYMLTYPNQNREMKIKNWRNFFKTRFVTLLEKRYNSEVNSTIENCDFEFECPVLWSNLAPGQTSEERFCNKCQKTVHKVYSTESLHEAISMGRCVALFRLSTISSLNEQYERPVRMGSVTRVPLKKRVPFPFEKPNTGTPGTDDDLYE